MKVSELSAWVTIKADMGYRVFKEEYLDSHRQAPFGARSQDVIEKGLSMKGVLEEGDNESEIAAAMLDEITDILKRSIGIEYEDGGDEEHLEIRKGHSVDISDGPDF